MDTDAALSGLDLTQLELRQLFRRLIFTVRNNDSHQPDPFYNRTIHRALKICKVCAPEDLENDDMNSVRQNFMLQDLNGTGVEILETPPSALEFSRLVHVSRPVVIKGFQFPALSLWTDNYLSEKMGESKMTVAITPDGYADSISQGPDGRYYFVEPLLEKMSMNQLLSKFGADKTKGGDEVCYLQSQNGNLFSSQSFDAENDDDGSSEFGPLLPDVPKEIPWCSEALDQHPDAVNIWIGDERSVTSIHSDPYENVYTVIRGQKHFLLLPPTDSWCLKERLYPHATYSRTSPFGKFQINPSNEDVPQVRWSSIQNPAAPLSFPEEIAPIRITLHAGETLYLPVGWWHHVQQTGLTIALNWWYDAEMRGASWTLINFMRNCVEITSGNEENQT